MDKKTTAKVMFLHLIVALLINGIVYSLFNEMFDIPSPLLQNQKKKNNDRWIKLK